MYTKLLEETIRELKGEELEDDRRAAVNLKLNLRIDESYITDMNQRLAAYRRMASVRTVAEVDALIAELLDRYGQTPESVLNLGEYPRIRVTADRIGLDTLDREGNNVVFRFRQDAKLDPVWLLNMVQNRSDLTLLPPAVIKLDMTKPTGPPAQPKPVAAPPPGKLKPKSEQPGQGRYTKTAKPVDVPGRESWWATRATAGEVTGGFSRQEVLAEVPPDPRAPGGVFERVRQVLDEVARGLTTG